VTSGQWEAVLHDSALVQSLDHLCTQLDALTSVHGLTARDVGRRLFGLVDEMISAYSTFRAVLGEVYRFQPPDSRAVDVTALAELDLAVRSLVSDAISCLAEGLDGRPGILARVPRLVEFAASLFDHRPVDDEPDLRFELAGLV
jgi:hypothetical protein